MSELYLMCGVPGSGKSTFVQKHLSEDAAYVSRDEIRFSMLEDGEDYFAKEDEVFKEFCSQVSLALARYDKVFADATHLNLGSRMKLLRNITTVPDTIGLIFMNVPLEVCLKRNEKRVGRKYVPEDQIRRMYASLALPTPEEDIQDIYFVDENGDIQSIKSYV